MTLGRLWQQGPWWHGICLACLDGPPADPDPQRVLWGLVAHLRHHHPEHPAAADEVEATRIRWAA